LLALVAGDLSNSKFNSYSAYFYRALFDSENVKAFGENRQTLYYFAGAIVDHDEDAQAAAVEELVGSEVERPALVRPLGDRHGRSRAQRPLAPAPTPDHEALFAVDALEKARQRGPRIGSSSRTGQTPIANG
jgi:hypothetical protein